MRYYIDAYNVLFQIQTPKSSLEEQREWLIALIEQIVTAFTHEVIIVFDGVDYNDYTRSNYKDLEIVYTGNSLCADQYMIQELQRLNALHDVRIVTSDKGLARQARGLGSKVITPKQFIKQQKKRVLKQECQDKVESLSFSLNTHYIKVFEERLKKRIKD
jgi:predicted RNA-binding protein with PIN domain